MRKVEKKWVVPIRFDEFDCLIGEAFTQESIGERVLDDLVISP